MEPTPDELAGVADLFSGLTIAEFRRAVENIAARKGTAFDPAALDERIENACREYYLVAFDRGGEEVFAPGPAALPTLPDHAEDLPHIMDVRERDIDPEALAVAVEERIERDARVAIEEGDRARLRRLLDVCYDAGSWGPVEVAALRDRLAGAIEEV